MSRIQLSRRSQGTRQDEREAEEGAAIEGFHKAVLGSLSQKKLEILRKKLLSVGSLFPRKNGIGL